MPSSKTTEANRTYGSIVLRGGRMTKWKGKAASLSPSLGQLIASVSPVALGRALMVGANRTATAAVLGGAGLIVTTSGASANCTLGDPGVYTCSGTMENGHGDLSNPPTTDLLDVTVSPSTTFNVTSGDAFDLDSSAGITFTNNNSEVTIAGAVDGINAYNYAPYGGALSITTTGDTTGGDDGISARNSGTGALSITTTGTTTGGNEAGIHAYNPADGIYAGNYGTSLTIKAATTTGVTSGIYAINSGTGALEITTTGTTTGKNNNGIKAGNKGTSLTIKAATTTGGKHGIVARNEGTGALSITTTDDTTGGTSGIDATNNGTGALEITTTGTTTGKNNDGIKASNSSAGTSLTIKAATTTGGKHGIYALNKGTGALIITTTGTTKGTSSNGIGAYNSSLSTGDLTIKAATTTGGTFGISARNYGTGALSITTTGTTTGKNNDGIYANNFGTSLTINAATTTGGKHGIAAVNYGTGALSITTTGTTTGDNETGISAGNIGTSLTIKAATTTGGKHGIYAHNKGTGALSITTTGTTTSKNNDGIYAKNDGTSLTIEAATTTGVTSGIYANNYGSGALSITTTGTTTGTVGHGIIAVIYSYNSSSDLKINAANTEGGKHGIAAVNYGTGALSITTTGTTTGTINSGILAYNISDSTGGLTINAATTTGGTFGIKALNYGTGALSITTTGTTTGGKGSDGIYALNEGTGALEITTTGTTKGTSHNGIFAINSTVGTSLTINAATTTGGIDGIYADNRGTGALSITTTDDTTGGTSGISADNKGTGALSITTTGTTKGTAKYGIGAYNSSLSTGDLTIKAATTTGGTFGISARNYGTGALSITTTGTTTGTAYHGINASNSSASKSDLTINAASTTGGGHGIHARNNGTGTLNITTSGAITGGTYYGIAALTSANKTTNITLNSGTVVSSTAGLGIFNNGGNSTTTVNTGASVAGKIVLGDGVDSLNFAGGDFSGVTLFDGGAGTSDTLKFSGSSGSVNGSLIKNWESVEINKDSTIAFSNNKLTTGMLKTNTGGTLNAISGTFALTGNLSNAGTVNMVNAKTSDKVTVSGTSTGGGQIKMDVNANTNKSDKLAVAGNSSGKTTLAFTNLTPGKETGSTINDVVSVAGTSSATDFSGSMLGGIYTYKLTYDAGSFDLVGALNSTSSVYKVAPTILGGFNQLSSLNQRKSHRQVESRSDKTSSNPKVALTEQRQPNVWLDTGWTRAQEKTPSGISFENTNQDLTLGVDFDVDAGGSSGNWVVGGYVQSGTQEASITDATGTGSITSRGRGIGATATWYGNAGTYVDAQGQITRLESDMSSSAGGVLAESVSSKAYALSLEVGHHIALSEKAGLIPQGQLSWGRIDGAEFTDTGNTAVDMGSNDTQTGRVGLAYEYVIDNQSTFYAIGSIVRDFKRANKVKAGTASFSEDINETWGEIGIGGSIVLDEASGFGSANKTTKLYGGVFQRQSSNNSDIKVLAVNAGIQIEW